MNLTCIDVISSCHHFELNDLDSHAVAKPMRLFKLVDDFPRAAKERTLSILQQLFNYSILAHGTIRERT